MAFAAGSGDFWSESRPYANLNQLKVFVRFLREGEDFAELSDSSTTIEIPRLVFVKGY
jgi:hypothetical protein